MNIEAGTLRREQWQCGVPGGRFRLKPRMRQQIGAEFAAMLYTPAPLGCLQQAVSNGGGTFGQFWIGGGLNLQDSFKVIGMQAANRGSHDAVLLAAAVADQAKRKDIQPAAVLIVGANIECQLS